VQTRGPSKARVCVSGAEPSGRLNG
jgi:hypothetical protein